MSQLGKGEKWAVWGEQALVFLVGVLAIAAFLALLWLAGDTKPGPSMYNDAMQIREGPL